MRKMINLDYYLVDKDMFFMMGEYDQRGKLCARVVTGNKSYLVDRSCLQIINDSLNSIGYDLKGAITGAKSILGDRMMCPILVNPYQGICLFPNKSPRKDDCIWFNTDHIVNTKAFGSRTIIEFSNYHTILVDSKLVSFNNKMQIANQLKQISAQRGNHPTSMTFYLKPKKGLNFTKDATGSYNFIELNETAS